MNQIFVVAFVVVFIVIIIVIVVVIVVVAAAFTTVVVVLGVVALYCFCCQFSHTLKINISLAAY